MIIQQTNNSCETAQTA
uniref:Uncharacterized protein n=1 Tax=Anguilla anguilla TaxID=7936 RepID=A0A0E9REG3_ANGAN